MPPWSWMLLSPIPLWYWVALRPILLRLRMLPVPNCQKQWMPCFRKPPLPPACLPQFPVLFLLLIIQITCQPPIERRLRVTQLLLMVRLCQMPLF